MRQGANTRAPVRVHKRSDTPLSGACSRCDAERSRLRPRGGEAREGGAGHAGGDGEREHEALLLEQRADECADQDRCDGGDAPARVVWGSAGGTGVGGEAGDA